jgi:hypothetical protein
MAKIPRSQKLFGEKYVPGTAEFGPSFVENARRILQIGKDEVLRNALSAKLAHLLFL